MFGFKFILPFVVLLLTCTAYADTEKGEQITDYEEHHLFRISPQYVDKPIDIRMPKCWDGDVDAVRVKLAYKDAASPHGTSVYYLRRANWPLEYRKDDNGNQIIKIVLHNPGVVDILYIDFVFRVEKGVSCA